MPTVKDLADPIVGLFEQSLQSAYDRFSQEDRDELVAYANAIAVRAVARKASTDSAQQAKLDQEISGFTGAIHLMADRYMLAAAHDTEKQALNALKVAAEWTLKIIVAAIA